MNRPCFLPSCTSLLLTFGLAAPASAQIPIATDNRDGVQADFEVGPVNPLEKSGDGRLWCVNIHDASVSVFDTSPSLTLIDRVYVGMGPVTIVRRPSSNELWVVCTVSNQVLVIDSVSRRVMDGVRVEFEPRDCVFDTSGAFAYVSLGATNQIKKVNASTRGVVATFEFGDDPDGPGSQAFLHCEEPRSLLIDGSTLYGLSFEGGNGSIPIPFAVGILPIVNLWENTWIMPPRDLDVVQFDLSNASPTGVGALQRVGAINLDLLKIPASGNLIVSNMQLKNFFPSVGEFTFKKGGIAEHRLTIAAPGADPLDPLSMQHIDLNLSAAFMGLPATFSMPTEMAIDAAGRFVYVACFESRNTAVVDLATKQVHAVLNAGGPSGAGFGPRGLLLDELNGRLYVYNRADSTLDEFSVPVTLGSVNNPVRTISLGLDVTAPEVMEGRIAFIDAQNSSNGAQSCNTCHIDGHLDRVAWDLSAFTGNTLNQSEGLVGKDVKGIRVTQSLYGIEETEPLHWRGDRRNLHEFAGAIGGLLGGTPDPVVFDKIVRYVHTLTYRPNHLQNADRTLTSTGSHGLLLFETTEITPMADSQGNTRPTTCIECHSLNGFSGTNNQVNSDAEIFVLAEDATQLRGLQAKASDLWTNTADWSFTGFTDPVLLGFFTDQPVTGFGFASIGTVDTVFEFVDIFFPLNGQDALDTAEFCNKLDPGSAPAIGFACTIKPSNAGNALTSMVNTYLIPQANAFHIDLVARGWLKPLSSSTTWTNLKLLFNTATQKFEADTPGFGPFTLIQIFREIVKGKGTFTFFGAPRGAGIRLGKDGDLDGEIDGAEAAKGASNLKTDTDGDGYPDGHEIINGSNPNNQNSTPVDTTPPVLSEVVVAWTNSNTVKIRWRSNEIATSRVRVTNAGGDPFDAMFEENTFKTYHVLVARGMQPKIPYQISVEGDDPSSNSAVPVIKTETMEDILFPDSMYTNKVEIFQGNVNPDGTYPLRITVEVRRHDGSPVPNATVNLRVVEWIDSTTQLTNKIADLPGTTGANGTVQLGYTTFYTQGSGANLDAFVTSLSHSTYMHFFPLSGASGFHAQLTIQ